MQLTLLSSVLALSGAVLAAPTAIPDGSATPAAFSKLVSGVKAHDASINSTVVSFASHTLSATDATSFTRGNISAIHSLLTGYTASLPSSSSSAPKLSQQDSKAIGASFTDMTADMAGTLAGVKSANIPGLVKRQGGGDADLAADLKSLVDSLQYVDEDVGGIEDAVEGDLFDFLRGVLADLGL